MTTGATQRVDRPRAAKGGSCQVVGHTADVGLRAAGPDLETAFAALARGFARLTARTQPGTRGVASRMEVAGRDLPELAFNWLNELVAVCDERRAAILDVEVDPIHPPEPPLPERSESWRIAARLWLVPFGPDAAPRTAVKSATYHRLAVRPTSRGWTILAYLDI